MSTAVVSGSRQSLSFANMFSIRWRFYTDASREGSFDFRFFSGEIQAVTFRSAKDCLIYYSRIPGPKELLLSHR